MHLFLNWNDFNDWSHFKNAVWVCIIDDSVHIFIKIYTIQTPIQNAKWMSAINRATQSRIVYTNTCVFFLHKRNSIESKRNASQCNGVRRVFFLSFRSICSVLLYNSWTETTWMVSIYSTSGFKNIWSISIKCCLHVHILSGLFMWIECTNFMKSSRSKFIFDIKHSQLKWVSMSIE